MERTSVLSFGAFEFDLHSGELRKYGLRLKLQPKPAAVLSLLVNNPGKIVTTSQLRAELWPSDTFVDFEHGLGIAIWKLRSLLGDSAKNPRFIETVPRKGYKFLAPVQHAVLAGKNGAKRMLAIVPFDNLNGSGLDDHFSEGLTEELITQLGRLNPHRLGVIARTSMVRYKSTSKTVNEIASELGVGYLLIGTVRRRGTRFRITAQLVQASDQTPIWTACYDRLAKDLISAQIDLADEIAGSLAVELLPEQEERVARTQRYSPEAHEFYLQGRFFWNKRTPGSNFTAIEYFRKAIKADPVYAPAYVGLADCFAVLGFYGDLLPTEAFENAKRYARRALEIDTTLAEAHSCLAFSLLQYDWDWAAAEREHLEAIQLNPNCAPAHHWYGLTLTQVGSFSDALRSFRRALELDPFDVAIHTHTGRLSYLCRHFDRAANELRAAIEIDNSYLPGIYNYSLALLHTGEEKKAIRQLEEVVRVVQGHPIPLSALVFAYGKVGRHTAARRGLEQMIGASKNMRVPPYFFAFAEAGLGHTEEALEYLQQAYTERFGWLFFIKMDAVFDCLRSDPRFNDLIHRIQPGCILSSGSN